MERLPLTMACILFGGTLIAFAKELPLMPIVLYLNRVQNGAQKTEEIMAVKIRCPKCYLFNSVKNNSCTKCGQTFKNKKSFYIEYIINKKVKCEYAGLSLSKLKTLKSKRSMK